MTDLPCTCGNNGVCIACVLTAFEKEEQDALEALLEEQKNG